jgi:hypothetical protein
MKLAKFADGKIEMELTMRPMRMSPARGWPLVCANFHSPVSVSAPVTYGRHYESTSTYHLVTQSRHTQHGCTILLSEQAAKPNAEIGNIAFLKPRLSIALKSINIFAFCLTCQQMIYGAAPPVAGFHWITKQRLPKMENGILSATLFHVSYPFDW